MLSNWDSQKIYPGCQYFLHPDIMHVSPLGELAQCMATGRPPDADLDEEISKTEVHFLGDTGIERLVPKIEDGTWGQYHEYCCPKLRDYGQYASRYDLAERVAYVARVPSTFDPIKRDRGLLTAITRTIVWSGGRNHGLVLMVADDFVDATPAEQASLIRDLASRKFRA